VATSTTVTATFNESVQAASISFVLKDPGNNSVPATVSYNDTTHTATLTPSAALAGTTTYTATVSGATDSNGNVMAAPVSWSFTTTAVTNVWQQTTAADFSAGTQSSTLVTNNSGGEVQLAPSFEDDFNGTTLGSSWTTTSWASLGGGPANVSVSGGILSVAGSEVRSVQNVLGSTIEGRINFAAAPYLHFGVATNLNATSGNYWAIFSTAGSTNTLYARVNVNGTTTDVSLGALPSGYHVYRVQPVTGGFQFSVDGVVQSTITATFPTGTALKIALSAFNGTPLLADWVRIASYPSTGTFTSAVFIAGRTATWGVASWTATTPTGTTITVQTRSGNTATPDGTWSAWAAVANGAAVASPAARYLQYRVILTTSDSTQTAVLFDISFKWS
jgi:hypothetical protein